MCKQNFQSFKKKNRKLRSFDDLFIRCSPAFAQIAVGLEQNREKHVAGSETAERFAKLNLTAVLFGRTEQPNERRFEISISAARIAHSTHYTTAHENLKFSLMEDTFLTVNDMSARE